MAWNFLYSEPDANNHHILGHVIAQEKATGRAFERSRANFFETDATLFWGTLDEETTDIHTSGGSFQMYSSLLYDSSPADRRNNLFAMPVVEDLLGTLGGNLQVELGRTSFSLEAARNFGRAWASGEDKDLTHKGYLLYTDLAVAIPEVWISPHSQFLLVSGNKLQDSEGGVLQGSANRAFSVYSPFNTFLWDSVYQQQFTGPAIATANLYGLNSGVLRPGTYGDPYILENLITPSLGIDIIPIQQLTLSLDWWYLSAFERGIGGPLDADGNVAYKKLSRDLGHELDALLSLDITEWLSIETLVAYFIPGKYYSQKREDGGTDFSPQIRGDGDVDGVFHSEIRLTVRY